MELGQAIAHLLNSSSDSKSESKLSDIFAQLEQVLPAADSQDDAEVREVDDIFAQLATAARLGQTEIFTKLVEAERERPADNEPTLLMAAVMAGQLEVVKALIATGVDVNVKIEQIFKFSALEFAVKRSKLAIAQALLQAGADPNWANANPSFSMIVKAIEQSDTEMVRLLLHHGASVVFETDYKPLVTAAEKGNPGILLLLLAAGCDVDDTDYRGSALQTACGCCHVEAIETLLAADAELDKSGRMLSSIFSAPFMAKQLSGLLGEQPNPTHRILLAIKALVEAGADVNAKGQDGTTPLILAVSEGYSDVVELLLSAGADPNLQGNIWAALMLQKSENQALYRQYSQPTTPLNLAVAFGYAEIAEMLIVKDANVAFVDEQGRRALSIAIKEGRKEIVELLQSLRSDEETSALAGADDTLLGAAKRGTVEDLQVALAAGANPDTSELSTCYRKRRKTALMFATERGALPIVKALVAAGANVNLSDRPGKKLGKTPLMVAARQDHAKVARFLIESSAAVDAQDKRGQTALLYAIEENAVAAVAVLLHFGADIHKKSWDGTPFKNATYADSEISKLVIRADRKRKNGANTAELAKMLSMAAFSGDAVLVRELIQQGVDVNATEPGGFTALMSAMSPHSLDCTTVVQLLLAAGADVHAGAELGETALSKAAYWGLADPVSLLISAGADVNVANQCGHTPLMHALVWNAVDVVEVLLKAGADASLKNDEGMTVLAIAQRDRKRAIVNLLRNSGVTA